MNKDNTEYIHLLKKMISTPSFSRDEGAVSDIVFHFLQEKKCNPERIFNNIICRGRNFDPNKPTLMLNSHLDTVRPSSGYTRDPFSPDIEGDRLFGLGSNDAGASVVSLISTFIEYMEKNLNFNLILAVSAEEECSGEKGMRAIIPEIGKIDMAIVGEPTGMNAATGEHGLVVLDCISRGVSGHAARKEGVNALYAAVDDINTLRGFRFPKKSDTLGEININVTQIEAGTQHNVIPDKCKFVVDIRTTDAYTNIETVEILRKALKSEITPRSTRLQASAISSNHPLVRAAVESGAKTFNSPTTSDMALMPFPSLKIGPGDSARSHSADEFILLSEINNAIDKYSEIINTLNNYVR